MQTGRLPTGTRQMGWYGLLLMSLMLSGCGDAKLESTVAGTVTLDGEFIGPGIIQFFPVGGGHNPATGTIDVDGRYQMKTNNTIGLLPGEYQVTVAIYDQPDVAPGERAAPGSAPLRIPQKYISAKTTDLKFSVTSGKNEIDVPLSSN